MTASNIFGSLCIRADAGSPMGIGHVMRCLALAQAWRDLGGKVRLISAGLSEALRDRIENEGVATTLLNADPAGPDDMKQTTSIVRAEGPGWLVLDGYHFGKGYREGIKAADLRLLVVDDLADTDLRDADIILNQNAYADPAMYAGCAPQASLLLGPDHALLRREFLSLRTQRPAAARAENILVTLGGADPGNVTQRVMQSLTAFTAWRLQVTIVVGVANPHLESLRALLPALQRQHDAEVAVNPSDLPERMSRADLAITAAGSTCWELAYLGVPMLATVTANNQVRVARKIVDLGMADLVEHDADLPLWLTKFDRLARSQEVRLGMIFCSQMTVNGRGSRRVAEALATHPITLRAATSADAGLLWEWVNDPAVRQSAFSMSPIAWEQHQLWFARRIGAPDCSMWIGLDQHARPVGQARFEGDNGIATIDVSIAPSERGRGYASKLIRLAAYRALEDRRWHTVQAWIKPENVASQRSFARAGFRCEGECFVKGQAAIGYVWSANDDSKE